MSAINEEFVCVGLISPWSEYGDVMAYLKTKSDSDSVIRRTLVLLNSLPPYVLPT